MKQVWEWMKKHVLALALSLVGVLSILLAVKYEQAKIQKLKVQSEKVKLDASIGLSGVISGEVKGTEGTLKPIDTTLQNWLKKDNEAIKNAKIPQDRNPSDIAVRFNQLYGRDNGSRR
jgi:hypothetical protein